MFSFSAAAPPGRILWPGRTLSPVGQGTGKTEHTTVMNVLLFCCSSSWEDLMARSRSLSCWTGHRKDRTYNCHECSPFLLQLLLGGSYGQVALSLLLDRAQERQHTTVMTVLLFCCSSVYTEYTEMYTYHLSSQHLA